MRHNNRWLILVLIISSLLFAACSGAANETSKVEPASVEPIEGTELNRVTLTEKAAQRLQIESSPVREEQSPRSGAMQMAVPYSAVIYDLNGDTWVYTRNPGPESLTFEREPITIDYIEGDLAFVSEGPALGTEVATVAVAELYGIDTGVGK